MKTKYLVLERSTLDALENDTQNFLNMWWELQWGVSQHIEEDHTMYTQAIKKLERKWYENLLGYAGILAFAIIIISPVVPLNNISDKIDVMYSDLWVLKCIQVRDTYYTHEEFIEHNPNCKWFYFDSTTWKNLNQYVPSSDTK